MSDGSGGRSYSEDEFALILRQAADLTRSDGETHPTTAGYSLEEIKSIATEAGLDPALIERAARALPVSQPLSPIQRLLGGPGQLKHQVRHTGALSADTSKRLLAAIRARMEQRGDPDLESGGFYWTSTDFWGTNVVSAHQDGPDTEISVNLDGRAFLISSGILGTAAALFATFVVVGLGEGGLFGLPVGLGLIGTAWGATLGLVRSLWSFASRRRREKLAALLGSIEKVMGDDREPEENTTP